jgi:hypothetical protein
VGAIAITIAATSNNFAKACYAYGFSDRRTGWQSFSLLSGLSLSGLMPVVWMLM